MDWGEGGDGHFISSGPYLWRRYGHDSLTHISPTCILYYFVSRYHHDDILIAWHKLPNQLVRLGDIIKCFFAQNSFHEDISTRHSHYCFSKYENWYCGWRETLSENSRFIRLQWLITQMCWFPHEPVCAFTACARFNERSVNLMSYELQTSIHSEIYLLVVELHP